MKRIISLIIFLLPLLVFAQRANTGKIYVNVGQSGTNGTVTSVGLAAPTGFSVTGSPVTSAGTLSLGFASGYSLPTISNQNSWTAAYNSRIASFTTTGNSGAATFIDNTLNIPNYSLVGLGGQPLLNGTGYVKMAGTTVSYDNTVWNAANSNLLTVNWNAQYLNALTAKLTNLTDGYLPLHASDAAGLINANVFQSGGILTYASPQTFNAPQQLIDKSYVDNNFYLASNPNGYISTENQMLAIDSTSSSYGISITGKNRVSFLKRAGTVTSIATNVNSGLAGGTITTTGALSLDVNNLTTRTSFSASPYLPYYESVNGTNKILMSNINLTNFSSSGALNGQVPTANGAGGITWGAAGGMVYPSGSGFAVVSGGAGWGTTVPLANVPYFVSSITGTASASTYLRGDGAWAAISAGGNVSNTGTPLDNQIPVWTNATTIEGDADFTFDGTNMTVTGTVAMADANADNKAVSLGQMKKLHAAYKAKSGTGYFQLIHSFVSDGTYLYAGERVDNGTPDTVAYILKIDPNTLAVVGSYAVGANLDVESMCINPSTGRLYATRYNSNNYVEIIELNPSTMTLVGSAHTYNTLSAGASYPIITDGTYIYGATYMDPAVFFKIRLSDWALVSTNTWINGERAHSAKLDPVGGFFYCVDIPYSSATSPYFAKVSIADLSYSEVSIGTYVRKSTDDFAILNDNGTVYCYVGGEYVTGSYGGVRVRGYDLALTGIVLKTTYGIDSDGKYLYSACIDGDVQVFDKDNLANIITYDTYMYPNEILCYKDRVFMTNFLGYNSAVNFVAELVFPGKFNWNFINSPTNGQVITWNSTAGQYEWKTVSGGSGATNLTFTGASSPVTLNSDTGTDVVFSAGTNISLTQTGNNLTINNTQTVPADGKITNVTFSSPNLIFTGSNGAFSGNVTLSDATASTKGIASFNSSNFSVTSGVVSVATNGITSSNLADKGTTTQILYNNGGTVTGSSNLTFDGTNVAVGGYITNDANRVQSSVTTSLDGTSGLIAMATTLTAPRTITLSNIPDGHEGTIDVTQDASGGWDVSIAYTGMTLKKMGSKSTVNKTANAHTTIVYWRVGSTLFYGFLYDN